MDRDEKEYGGQKPSLEDEILHELLKVHIGVNKDKGRFVIGLMIVGFIFLVWIFLTILRDDSRTVSPARHEPNAPVVEVHKP